MKCATIHADGRIDQFIIVNGQDVGVPGIIIGKDEFKTFIPVGLTKSHQEQWEKGKVVKLKQVWGYSIGEKNYDIYELPEDKNDYYPYQLLCVFKADVGEEGGNTFTGDYMGMMADRFHDFPGKIIAEAYIVGKGNKTEIGRQIIAVFGVNQVIFRIGYSQKEITEKDLYFKINMNSKLIGGITAAKREGTHAF